jgi:hypothetical protein
VVPLIVPPLCSVSRRPIWAGTRSDNLLVGPGTPRGQNVDTYGGYPGEDAADRRGKKPVDVTEEGPSQEAAPATKKRKLGTAVGGVGVSDSFAVDLMGTCAAPGGRMSSPELRESSERMLEVTGGRWPRNVPVPRAAGEDFFTSRMARELKVFPYGRNIAAVVSGVMERDR